MPNAIQERIKKNIAVAIVLLFGSIFVIKFGGPAILRFYIETGLGNCQKIPILCIKPQGEELNPDINDKYLFGLPYCELQEIQICTPKEFKLIKQKLTKIYPKERGYVKGNGATIYLLYEKPNFFVNLFPQSKQYGIDNDYEFLSRIMSASIKEINNLTDAFFVIMKGVFTPDLGNLNNVKISKFKTKNLKGFISYNLGASDNYFDCNIFDNEGNYFKAYIKDKGKLLDLDKVFAIISTIKKVGAIREPSLH